ncbi:MAG: 30S ribosomal protein S15 [Candidatus Micrarchaeota archaeon]
MARMHARKKGKSGSKKPIKKITPEWCQYSKEEASELIIKLFKEGKSLSVIGIILRDQYGIPNVKTVTGKSVSQILSGEKLMPEWPEDIMNLMKKSVKLRKHISIHKSDNHNTRTLHLTESKIRRLVKYYKKAGKISGDWFYKPEEAALLIKE